MSDNDIKEMLKCHQHWLNEDIDGWEKMRANLREANLRGANLRGADLREANLWRADLREANLLGADLRGADLRGADLRVADLLGADLRGADLRGADLREANLRGAYLREANLREANLWGADLRVADLRGADLREADLREANLWGADLRGAKNVPYIPLICPGTGAFIGWKKANINGVSVIVKLMIPEDAKRSSATTRKCRCDRAIVLAIESIDGDATYTEARSCYDGSFRYVVGETVEPKEAFDDDRWNECGSGIHFFINRQEAVEYL